LFPFRQNPLRFANANACQFVGIQIPGYIPCVFLCANASAKSWMEGQAQMQMQTTDTDTNNHVWMHMNQQPVP